MDNHHLTRADYRILNGSSKLISVAETVTNKEIPVHVDALIRKLAETYSQGDIAKLLNKENIIRPNGGLWCQFHVSRYFKEHSIKSAHKWRGPRNIAHDRDDMMGV